jgi:hypothetical protein
MQSFSRRPDRAAVNQHAAPAGARQAEEPVMEAERVNAIVNHLADLERRSSELRRYL